MIKLLNGTETMKELRGIIKANNLHISTTGKGRMKAIIIKDINNALRKTKNKNDMNCVEFIDLSKNNKTFLAKLKLKYDDCGFLITKTKDANTELRLRNEVQTAKGYKIQNNEDIQFEYLLFKQEFNNQDKNITILNLNEWE
eukprot:167780_1